MKFNRKLLEKIKEIHFDTSDYYGYWTRDEDGDLYFVCGEPESEEEVEEYGYAHELMSEELNDIMTLIGDEDGVMSGTMGLWNGDYSVPPHVGTLQELLDRLKDTDELVIEWDDDEQAIRVENHHHDGVNTYFWKPFNIMKKDELQEVAKQLAPDEVKSRMTREELIDIIYENAEKL